MSQKTVAAKRPQAQLFEIFLADTLDWLAARERHSIHAVVTDPPYGLLEYQPDQIAKMKNGRGGVWRIPPSFDGAKRRPLPRFTALNQRNQDAMVEFFKRFAERLEPVLVPGAHVFIATNPLVSHLVANPFIESGYETRGQIIRIVRRLRGGDRPKNAHVEFRDVTVLPKSCWEPWLLFR